MADFKSRYISEVEGGKGLIGGAKEAAKGTVKDFGKKFSKENMIRSVFGGDDLLSAAIRSKLGVKKVKKEKDGKTSPEASGLSSEGITFLKIIAKNSMSLPGMARDMNVLRQNVQKLVAGSEGMRYKDEPWGNENLMQAYGPYVHEQFKDNEIYNVGTIGGVSEYVKDMVFNILFNAINRPIPICDQAVYNVLIQTQPFKGVTYFAKQLDGWACQAGTTVDPSKIAQFRPHLLESEPKFEDGIVKTSLGKTFAIVHQYDRVPEWKEFIKQKYQQEELITFRTE